MKHSRLAVLLLSLALIGCASTPEGEGSGPRRQANLLTQDQIQASQTSTLHDAISALRPNWLQQRGTASLSDPSMGAVMVYMDGAHIGGAEVLRQMLAGDTESVRFLSAAEAQSRFGTRQNAGPAIVVQTRRAANR